MNWKTKISADPHPGLRWPRHQRTRTFFFPLAIFLMVAVPLRILADTQPSAANTPPVAAPGITAPSEPAGIQPFGANLFSGNFIKTREDGLNPNYVVMPGDRVAVYTWGAVSINEVFVVDGQGNIFVPDIGPVRLQGVKNSELTETMKEMIRRVYTKGVSVYTNLLTANPVAVFVTGAVKKPGRYAGIPSDSVLFFLDQAGGIDPQLGSYRNIAVLRDGEELARVDLYDFILQGKLETVQFKDRDTILVMQRGPVVELRGDVAAPALIEFTETESTGTDALAVIPKAATATEVTLTGLRNHMPISRTMTVAAFQHEKLYDGDVITMRQDGRAETIIVKLEGEFEGPSMLSVRRGAKLIDVLNFVPVNPEFTNTGAVHIKRLSVARAQKDAINDSLFRLERSALLALSHSQGEAQIRVKEAELTAQFVERARTIDPLGRVVTSQDGKQLNITLEQGDVIVIPKKTNVVRIGGEVMMSQAVMHKPGMTAEEYIALAGGYSDRADDNLVIVLHMDASVSMEDPDVEIKPGDEILVPPEIDVKELQNAMDVMQIIYQVAVSAAVVLAL
ncbi:MAG: polysaccharide biosynthesis/export family protein [Myxococcota bacterium]|nr:polysaccharide biosynthesis/export family protein [Myxococcota bacterium]